MTKEPAEIPALLNLLRIPGAMGVKVALALSSPKRHGCQKIAFLGTI
jgi:hypothetical protein